jgi:hypothetical protein
MTTWEAEGKIEVTISFTVFGKKQKQKLYVALATSWQEALSI